MALFVYNADETSHWNCSYYCYTWKKTIHSFQSKTLKYGTEIKVNIICICLVNNFLEHESEIVWPLLI